MSKPSKLAQHFVNLSADDIIYPVMAGYGALLGLMIGVLILLPLSFWWPFLWDAAFWVQNGIIIAGVFLGRVKDDM